MTFSTVNMRETFGRTLAALGERYDKLLVLDADLNTSTRTVLFKQRFPGRFFQCGIAEGNMMALAAGLAAEGFVVVPATFAAFATRKALDQVFMNICTESASVKIPGSYPGLTATECGGSHNEVGDLAVMRSLPGIKVAAPADNRELASMMAVMMETPGPVYFRVEKAEPAELFDADHRFAWGRGARLRDGGDVTLVGTGVMTAVAVKAAQLLESRGVEADVIHMGSIKPLDEGMIVESAARTGCVLTIENARAAGGCGGSVAEALARRAPTLMDMMGLGDVPVESAPLADLLRHYRLTPQDMAERAMALMAARDRRPAAARGGSHAGL
jgi:transketolase